MWNVELKAMDEFRHVLPHDLEYLGPVSQRVHLWKQLGGTTVLRTF